MRHRPVDRHFPMLWVANDKPAEAPAEVPADLSRRRLTELVAHLERAYKFRKGDVVRWKPGLKNRVFPEYGEPVIISEVLPDPIFDPSEASAASPFFREPLTIVIATVQFDELLEYSVDSRRFEPFC